MSRFVLAQLSRIKGFANKILPQRLSNYNYRMFFVFLLVVFFALSTKFVHAGFVEWIVEAISGMLLALANIAVALTIFFLRYFITLASYNNYIDVSVVKLGWVMVRDVANMFFVVSLLVIAFATILGIEKYEWKRGLVKLIIMAVLINFSNLIAQIIIDAAHVFTITFLNAISASAGGNLINMFSLDKISSIIQGKSVGDTLQSATSSIFAASFVAFLFAVGTAVVLGSYLIVMAIRVVLLWALIILSPLAYLFSALPNGEKYAKKWWSEFTKQVIVAPVMVFFMWLSFATLGTGQIMSEIQTGNTVPLQQSQDPISISITAVSSWENMANYILALLFLYIGLQMTKETGAYGAGMLESAERFIKKTATEAIGTSIGRNLSAKIKNGGKSVIGDYGKIISGKLGLRKIPFVGSESKSAIQRKAALKNIDNFYDDRRQRLTAERGGLPGLLAISEKRAAKENVQEQLARAKRQDIEKLERSNVKQKMIDKENEESKTMGKIMLEVEDKSYEKKKENAKTDEDRAQIEVDHASKIQEIKAQVARKVGGFTGMAQRELDDKETYTNAESAYKEMQSQTNLRSLISGESVYLKEYNRLVAKKKKDVKEKTGREHLSDQEKGELQRQAARRAGGLIEMLHRQNEAGRPAGKYSSEESRIVGGIIDAQRVEENKTRKAVRIRETKEVQEDLADMEPLGYDALKTIIQESYSTLAEQKKLDKIIKKQKKLKKEGSVDFDSAKLEEAKKKYSSRLVEKTTQNQARALASAITKGYGESVASFLTGTEVGKEFESINFNDPKFTHILDLALLSGSTLEDFKEDGSLDVDNEKVREKQAKINLDFIEKAKDKGAVLMRGLMMARNKKAKEGGLESIHQLSEGVDMNGDLLVGYSNIMASGKSASSDKDIASGTGLRGAEIRVTKSNFDAGNRNIRNVDGGSIGIGTTHKVNINGTDVEISTAYASEKMKKMIASVGNLTASEIAAMDPEKINRITGGDYEHSSFDARKGFFKVYDKDMKDDLGKLFSNFNANYTTSKSEQSRDNVKKAVRKFLEIAGAEGAILNNTVDEIISDSFDINDLIKIVVT